MKKLLNLALAAALFAGGYALGNREIRQVCQDARMAAAAPTSDSYALSLLELDLSGLQAVNPDVTGWIVIPDTSISYPLLQSADNEYYLNHNWQGTYSPGGSIFIESRCSADFSGFNTLIYGHRMRDDSMFNALQHYGSKDYLAAHPRVYIVTEAAVRVYEVFAACQVTVTAPVYWLVGEQAAYRQDVIDFCMVNSEIRAEIWPAVDGRIITLSTCAGLIPSDERWIVAAMEAEVITR